MKLSKVHIALLTNVTEGQVKNEHITMRYWKEVNANTVWERMRELNLRLPVDLFHNAYRNSPGIMTSWSGDRILYAQLDPVQDEFFSDPEFTKLFDSVSKPHITIGKNLNYPDQNFHENEFPNYNWNEGLKIGECHVGWKENGEMVYRTESELIDWIANNA